MRSQSTACFFVLKSRALSIAGKGGKHSQGWYGNQVRPVGDLQRKFNEIFIKEISRLPFFNKF
jgi:hypothetical protein